MAHTIIYHTESFITNIITLPKAKIKTLPVVQSADFGICVCRPKLYLYIDIWNNRPPCYTPNHVPFWTFEKDISPKPWNLPDLIRIGCYLKIF